MYVKDHSSTGAVTSHDTCSSERKMDLDASGDWINSINTLLKVKNFPSEHMVPESGLQCNDSWPRIVMVLNCLRLPGVSRGRFYTHRQSLASTTMVT